MYKLLSIEEDYMFTRYVELKNCETGKVEQCFDDSDVRNDEQKDFWFMQIGGIYECKILLFGRAFDLSETMEENCILCKAIGQELTVGRLKIIPVVNNENLYYVATKDIKNIKDVSRFAFDFSRKDLIQVDEIIAPKLLR
ncbi:MAG: hypothetical protein HDT47_05965 [Ruminococcaceae bacterium]|nr:hypothetical protein [Oscillospiraceae bacterium]